MSTLSADDLALLSRVPEMRAVAEAVVSAEAAYDIAANTYRRAEGIDVESARKAADHARGVGIDAQTEYERLWTPAAATAVADLLSRLHRRVEEMEESERQWQGVRDAALDVQHE